jgi:hypothetical protein
MLKTIKTGFWGLVAFALLPSIADAQIQNPIRFNSLTEFLEAILRALITIAVPIAGLFIIYSGFLFVTAQGNPAGLEKAKRTLLWTLVGVALIFGAWVLSQIIQNTIDAMRT